MSRRYYIIEADSEVSLSEPGYYGYYYRSRKEQDTISFHEDVMGEELTHWTNEAGYKAILLDSDLLSKYKNRPCNVVWVKE